MRFLKQGFRLLRVHPHHQAALPAGRNGHVAADQEGEAAEHALLGQPRLVADQLTNPVGEILVVGHRGHMVPGMRGLTRTGAGCGIAWEAPMRRRLADSARAFAATARNPSLARAQLAFAASWTAEWAFMVALGVVAFRDGGATAVGVVAFARIAPSFALAPIGTTLADRFRRDRVLMWSCLIRAAATAAATLLLATGGSLVAVYALSMVGTAAFTVFRPAHSALLPALCGTPLELTSANVVRGLADSASTLLGPVIAALLLDLGSPAAVFAATAALSLTAAVLLTGLSYEAPPRGAPQPLRRIVRETAEGFGALLRYRDAGILFGVGFGQTITRGFLNVFLVVMALELLDTGDAGVGVLTAAVGAGAVAGSLGASMFVTGRRLAALAGIGVALWGIPLTLCGLLPYEATILPLMAAIGIGNALVDIGVFTLPSRFVPEELLARAYGAFESVVALTVAVGALVTPPVIDLLGVRGALAALGLVAPAVVVLAWRSLLRIDASIAHRDAEIGVLNELSIFRPLPMAAINSLAQRVGHAHVDAGGEVFHQGDGGDRFYVIADGEAEVIGDGRFIRTIGPGDGFGEIALLHDTPRTATVRARTALELYTLDRQHFVTTINGYGSSADEADRVVDTRLRAFAPANESTR
jgi:MFS family permease